MNARIYISEREHSLLIRQTQGRRTPIATAFGGNRVWLSRGPDGRIVSDWALPLLAEWRGLTVADGAGI